MKKRFTASDKKEFLGMTKQIFALNSELSFNITSNDSKKTFKDMSSNNIYDDKYLKKIKSSLKKDSLNPLIIHEFGNYYKSKGDLILAKQYFKKTYDYLSIKYFPKDSASYYSFRGILKLNLEENGLLDIEKSLQINPNDSIGVIFYPILLVQNGKFEESKKICIKSLERESNMTEYSFLMLNTIAIFERFQSLAEENLNDDNKLMNKNTNYDKLIDYKIIDKYYDLYKSKIEIQNIRKMSDMLGLLLKISTFDQTKNDEPILEYNNYELAIIKDLEKYFLNGLKKKTINKYSGNKNLGFVNFLLKNNIKAIEYYKLAILDFPTNKETADFNLTEPYDMLITLYSLENDAYNLKNILKEKIKNAKSNYAHSDDFLMLAKCYLYENQYNTVEEWVNKAREIDAKNYKTLQLLAHLYYINNNVFLAQHYMEEAMKNSFTDSDNYNIIMQFAVYNILDNKPNEVVENFKVARKLLGSKRCTICDELMVNYIKTSN